MEPELPAGQDDYAPQRGGVPTPPDRRIPPGLPVRMNPAVMRFDGPDGCALVGGTTSWLVSLRRRAADITADWAAGRDSADPLAPALASRLIDAGVAHAAPDGGGPSPDDVTVVVPVKDRPEQLDRCLAAIKPSGPARVLVVDDGSADPDRTERVAAAHGAQVLRHAVNQGPAAARNTGLAAATTAYVAFVDSDCVPLPDWLTALLPAFQDPALAVAAPRITSFEPDEPAGATKATRWLARYEAVKSSLDLGPLPATVRPLSRVAYLPSAALLVRRETAGDGFRPDLRVGEDVDLIWRLVEAGWRVRYDPSATVAHEHRIEPAAFVRRRFDYGTSAAVLDEAHPGRVPAAVASPWMLAPIGLALLRRPFTAAAAALGIGLMVRSKLPDFPGRDHVSLELAKSGLVGTTAGLARAATRTWWPVSALAATLPGTVGRQSRLLLAASVVGPAVDEWRTLKPGLTLPQWTAARALDDLAYGAGVWAGAIRARRAGALLPRIDGVSDRLRKRR